MAEEAVEFARSSPFPANSELFTNVLVDQDEVIRGVTPSHLAGHDCPEPTADLPHNSSLD